MSEAAMGVADVGRLAEDVHDFDGLRELLPRRLPALKFLAEPVDIHAPGLGVGVDQE